MATTQAPPHANGTGQANGQGAPGPGRKKRNAAVASLAGNDLQTPEDLAAYLNTARKELHDMAEQLDLLAAEFHSAAVMLRKRLLRAAARTQNRQEKWAYRMMVRRSLKPFRGAAKAAASASDSASRSAALLRRFWRTYLDITESIVPKKRGER